MKLLIRDYVGSLKERQELDAILPDLLSELSYNVISRPGRGTTQRGVDVAAVGRDVKGERRLYLFTVKPGDLTRHEWDGTSQKLRSSINEIIDEYIPTRVPAAYKGLKIVIVVCLGGDVHESARSLLTQFTKRHTSRKISFEEWNGDKIAELLLTGVLREKVLPAALRSSFQKSVAMVDHPEISYDHFSRLLSDIRSGVRNEKSSVRAARQVYICLWVLFVWAREIDNLDAPYRASELALLHMWETVKPFIGKKTANARALVEALNHVIDLHIRIGALLLETKILPHVGRPKALSFAVTSRASVDVNLKLFDVLGRLAMTGLWVTWASLRHGTVPPSTQASLNEMTKAGMRMIANNPALFLPIQDEQAIEIALFLILSSRSGAFHDIQAWLQEMARRFDFAVRSRGRYPCRFADYEDLIDHPKDKSDEYLKDALAGSTLAPLLVAWLFAIGDSRSVELVCTLVASELKDCTLQLWMPDGTSEQHLYLDNETHGVALTDLSLDGAASQLLETIVDACNADNDFQSLSAIRSDYWPVVLAACRHYRLPVPPQFWIRGLVPPIEGPV